MHSSTSLSTTHNRDASAAVQCMHSENELCRSTQGSDAAHLRAARPWARLKAASAFRCGIEPGAQAGASGCIDRVDAGLPARVQVWIRKPRAHESANPTVYYTRKELYAVNVQAIADSTGRITWASVKCQGATHDSAAWP